MDIRKSLDQEPMRRQIEMPISTSLVSNSQKRSIDNKIESKKKEVQASEQLKETTSEKITRIAEAMDSYVQSIQRELKIQVHEGTGDIMVRVTSQDNGKVIREIPPKELLDLAARMEELAGTLFDEKI